MNRQTLIVTGGLSGLGAELARRYARQGAHIGVIDLRESEQHLQDIRASCIRDNQMIAFRAADISDRVACGAAIDALADELGTPDIVINSAGVQLDHGPFEQADPARFEKIIMINLVGSRNVALAAIPHLKLKGGRLVLIASMAGLAGVYGYSGYNASKFGVVGLASCLRIELKPENIRVQVVCPPEVDTPMVQEEHLNISPITYKLKMLSGSLSLKDAVDGIMKGLRGKSFIVIPGFRARLLFHISRLIPLTLTNAMVDRIVATEIRKQSAS